MTPWIRRQTLTDSRRRPPLPAHPRGGVRHGHAVDAGPAGSKRSNATRAGRIAGDVSG